MSEAFDPDTPLGILLTEMDLSIVDIGARGKPLPFMRELTPFAHYVACEPDAAEAERLERLLLAEGAWRGVTVFSDAIAQAAGERLLQLTKGPGMSSLLEPDTSIVDRYCKAGAFTVVDTRTVPTMPLDTAARKYEFEDACFLKVDTQGTELEILRSGERLVTDALTGVYVETLFQPFYREQSLFSDVDAYLRQHDFILFDMSRTHLRRTSERNTGYYSRRPVVWAHCLYLKDPATLDGVPPPRQERAVGRLVAMAVVFEHYDFAIEVLTSAVGEHVLGRTRVEGLVDDVVRRAAAQTVRLRRFAISDDEAEAVVACSARDER